MKRRAFLSLAGAAPLAVARSSTWFGSAQAKPSTDVVVIGGDASAFAAVYRLAQDPDLRVTLLHDAPPWRIATQPPASLADLTPFVRGHRLCFDGWRSRGNGGWGYDDVLPFFKRLETYEAGASALRGGEGPLAVSHCWDPHPAHRAFLMACAMSGFQQDSRHDFNGPRTQGVASYHQKTIRDDQPQTPDAAFLAPLRGRPNVRMLPAGHTRRIVFEGRRAVGVECVCGGERQTIRAEQAVMLCAEAARAAQLLILSGIGAGDELRALGVAVVSDRPGVGKNLHDHVRLPLRWRATEVTPASSVTAGMFTVSLSASPPDLQMDFVDPRNPADPSIGLDVTLVRPTARGSLTLRSADPVQAPALAPALLGTEADLTALIQGVRLGRMIISTSALDRWRGAEADADLAATGMPMLQAFVRRGASAQGRLAGTCAMGPATDEGSVVDASLRVHGTDGLWVAGAAIMPDVVNAPPDAASLMIGDRCADFVRAAGSRA